MHFYSERAAILAVSALLLSACGSGGSDRPPPSASAPVVNLSANPTAITAGQATTLTWSTTNATSCTASGGWSGVRGTSGTEQTAAIASTTTFTLACTGAGGSSSQSSTVTVNAPGGGNVVVSGKITFDRVPFKAPPLEGLNPVAPVESPARQVVVEAVDAGNGVAIASTTTDVNGDYALTVAGNVSMFIRARAQMIRSGAAPSWEFSVRNNTNSDALYTLDGSAFNPGGANATRNLKAAIGWNGTTYTDRSAAPFAILDTIYRAKELVLSGNPSAVLSSLNLYWASTNRPTLNRLCPDTGDIGTSFYIGAGGQDDCTPQGLVPAGIYILGDFSSASSDTDEFDQHVIAHEFGHYFEDRLSRSDSIGGDHGGGDRLDLRVAFGEGWGNAYAAMSLNDPAYRDSQQRVNSEFGFNLESDDQTAEGWFSEFSVGEILFDIFDSTADGADAVSLGFAPIFAVMTGEQTGTDALTSIYSFATALRATNSPQSGAIDSLLGNEGITGSGAFGTGESNGGGNVDALPVYEDVVPNQAAIRQCTNAASGTYNAIGNRRLLRFSLAQPATVTITVTGLPEAQASPPPDPDLSLWTRGQEFRSEAFGTQEMLQRPLPAGTHVLDIHECTHVSDPRACHPTLTNPDRRVRTCMNVQIVTN
jgi:hypothetical protein